MYLASSVPSERVFSLAGHVTNKKKACMNPKNMDMLIFLCKNMEHYWKRIRNGKTTGISNEPLFAYSFLYSLQITFVISKFKCSLSNKEVPVYILYIYIYIYIKYILHINCNVN